MSNEFRPLIEILRELKTLISQKASGFLFVVTEENHSCTIRVQGGVVEDVQFRMLRNDEAVQRLGNVNAARSRFQAGMAGPAGRTALSESSLQWLQGGFEHSVKYTPPARTAPAAATTQGSGPSERQRQSIQDIALLYLGPIAGILCDEAFENGNSLQQGLVQLASNLATKEESQRFMADIRKALG